MLSLFLLLAIGSHAEKRVAATPAQQQEMMEKIVQASAAMKSLVCEFEQTKELSILNEKMVSKGKMYYRQDNRLRWEYQSPFTYTFLLNDKKILMQSESSRHVIDVKASKLFQEIVKVMMNGINGNGLTDAKNFKSHYFMEGTQWYVELVPLQKEMKQLFTTIGLTFDSGDYSVIEVTMTERSGDETVIHLTQKQWNEELADSIFVID